MVRLDLRARWTVDSRVRVLPTITVTISQQSCERNPSRSRGALEDRVRQGKICEQGGGGKRNNSSVRGITNHHRHKKGLRDPYSVRGLKGLRDPHFVGGSNHTFRHTHSQRSTSPQNHHHCWKWGYQGQNSVMLVLAWRRMAALAFTKQQKKHCSNVSSCQQLILCKQKIDSHFLHGWHIQKAESSECHSKLAVVVWKMWTDSQKNELHWRNCDCTDQLMTNVMTEWQENNFHNVTKSMLWNHSSNNEIKWQKLMCLLFIWNMFAICLRLAIAFLGDAKTPHKTTSVIFWFNNEIHEESESVLASLSEMSDAKQNTEAPLHNGEPCQWSHAQHTTRKDQVSFSPLSCLVWIV